VFQYGAPLHALKITISSAQTLPTEARRLFTAIDYLHPASRLEREGNQSTLRFSRKSNAAIELLTNSKIYPSGNVPNGCFKLQWLF
jgi:hypothetical protein